MKLVEITKDSWLVRDEQSLPCGVLTKFNGGYNLYIDGKKGTYTKKQLSTIIPGIFTKISKEPITKDVTGYVNGYPVNYQNYICVEGNYGFPVFKKSNIGDTLYCAGYFSIRFNTNWVTLFCPKLKTVQKYPHVGPFSTLEELTNSHKSRKLVE